MKVRTRWIERLVDRLGRQPAHTGVTGRANATSGGPGKKPSLRRHPTRQTCSKAGEYRQRSGLQNHHGHARGRRDDPNVNSTNRPCDGSSLAAVTNLPPHRRERVGRGRAHLRVRLHTGRRRRRAGGDVPGRRSLVGFRPAAIAFSALSTIHAGAATDLERFQLFNECRPMFLLVETLPKGAEVIGLTVNSLAIAARSRLRSARLYTDTARSEYLYINVNVVGPAFSATLAFKKSVYDPVSALTRYAQTWEVGATGTHGKDAADVRSVVAENMDEFLDAFLRVNQAACANGTRPNPD